MPNILALDQGTTGSTAIVVDANGSVIGAAYREVPQFFPAPGEVEHDPADLLSTAVAAGRDAIAAAGVHIDAIGITNQRETVVAWDAATLAPIGRAIVWQDRRTSSRCAELRAQGHGDDIRRRTGLLVDPYFSATKFEWILRDAGFRGRASQGTLRFGTVESWLVANLTGGVHVTDRTNASRTMLADITTATWDADLLGLFGVPRAALPEIVPSAGSFGVCQASWFGHEIPICGLAGDQQAALYAQGCETAGAAKVTYGTGAFLLRHLGADVPQPGNAAPGILTTVAATAGDQMAWASEGSVFIAGAAVQWLRDGLGLIENASDTAALAASVADTGGVVVVPAFTGLGAPHWHAAARGTITGITRGTTSAHLARAVLEAIAHSTVDLVEAMGGVEALRVDGGASANNWLMQTQADLLGAPVERPAAVELTAFGAARLAAWGIGAPLRAAAGVGELTIFRPEVDAGDRAMRRREWRRAVGAALAWADDGDGATG